MTALHAWMLQLPFDWLQFEFMRNALVAVLLISPLFALLGCMVINNQMTFFSDAIGHSALTGIAIGALLGMSDPAWSMVGFAVLLALGITYLKRVSRIPADTIIGLCMAFTVALGVVLLSKGGGFNRYSKYLIGDILSITPSEITRLAVLFSITAVAWVLFFNRLLLLSINRSWARSRGVRVWLIEACFAALVALVVAISVPWVGLLVINSLLILPAAASRNMARSVPWYVLGSVMIGLVSGVAGLLASYYWATATGATIVLFAMGLFVLSVIVRAMYRK